uniref:Myosin-binding protein H n=1 Tax=Astyanax mexicanus TaxID=7994 RepID=W5K3F8_ASTMX
MPVNPATPPEAETALPPADTVPSTPEAPAAETTAPEVAPAPAAPAASPEASPKAPLSPPQNLTVHDVTNTSLTLKWSTPESAVDSGLDGYCVEYCKEGASEYVAANTELITSNLFVIKNQTTGDSLNVRVVAVRAGERSEPASLPNPITIREVPDHPRIRLPHLLRSRYIKQAGDQINLVIPFSGQPKPMITWTKNGQPLDVKKVNVRNSDKDSILFIRKAERDDSGTYQMTVKIDSLEDKATIVIQIVELPGPPTSVKLVDSWGFNAALEWTPPKDNGNTDITGYTVQKADKKTGEWFTVLEHFHRLNATITDLVMGNSYSFRVFSENVVGRSETAAVTKEVAKIQKTGTVYKPPHYKEHDFSEAPKFTASLSDRAATVGYTTRLLCAVRGSPKPKIEWMKNQMIIGDDPKFRQNSNLGVCSLEIRKPSSFDGGVYTCRAKNPYGEATVACKLEVKQVVVPTEEAKK